MEERKIKSFLGTGWSFPPVFQESTKTIKLVTEKEDIQQSLFLLISTIPGERIMTPRYGCDLHSMVFERLNGHTKNRIIDLITTAILLFEPRIIVEEVLVQMNDQDIGKIHIIVEYTIRITNSRDNIVYPFYFKEGTNVRGM